MQPGSRGTMDLHDEPSVLVLHVTHEAASARLIRDLAQNAPAFLEIFTTHPIFAASSFQQPAAGTDPHDAAMHRAVGLAVIFDDTLRKFNDVCHDTELTKKHPVLKTMKDFTKLAFLERVKIEANAYGSGTDRPCTFNSIDALVAHLESTVIDAISGLLTLGEQAVLKAMQHVYAKRRACLIGMVERAEELRFHDPSSGKWTSEQAGSMVVDHGKPHPPIQRLWKELKLALAHVHKVEVDKLDAFAAALAQHTESSHEDEAHTNNITYLTAYYDALIYTGVGKTIEGEWYRAGAEKSTLNLGSMHTADADADGSGMTMQDLRSANNPIQRCTMFSKCAFYFSTMVEKLRENDGEIAAWRIADMFAKGELCTGYPNFLDVAKLPPSRTEINSLLHKPWCSWPIATVLSVCTMCDAEHGARVMFSMATCAKNQNPIDEKWFGKIPFFDLYVKLVMAPPMVLQTCFLAHFLAKDFDHLMQEESTKSWRQAAVLIALREVCTRTDPVATARRMSDFLNAAHDGPKIQRLLHPIIRNAQRALNEGLAHWKVSSLTCMINVIKGWDGTAKDTFPDITGMKHDWSKRNVIIHMLKAWFADGMEVNNPMHRAKARLLEAGSQDFLQRMGEVYKEMFFLKGPPTTTNGTLRPVAFLPDVVYKIKSFIEFVRRVQRHCTTRRLLFHVARPPDPNGDDMTTLEGDKMLMAPADKHTFNTITRQYTVPERFEINTAPHPEVDAFNQDADQVDRKGYDVPPAATWNITRGYVTLGKNGHIDRDGNFVRPPESGTPSPSLNLLKESTAATVWRHMSDGTNQLIGYIQYDDTRDFFDVMARALEIFLAMGHHNQPCSMLIDRLVCSPNHDIAMFATTGEEHTADA